MPTPDPDAPHLADVVPSVLSAMGVTGFESRIPLPGDVAGACVLLIDGLGADLLDTYAADAPVLAGLRGQTLQAGFPSTTVAGLAALGAGRRSGEHGLVGYSFRLPDVGLINALRWRPHPWGDDLREAVPPEQVQPMPTTFERAASAGAEVSVISGAEFTGSGLTRAVLRGGRYVGVQASGTRNTPPPTFTPPFSPEETGVPIRQGCGGVAAVPADDQGAGLRSPATPACCMTRSTSNHSTVPRAPACGSSARRRPKRAEPTASRARARPAALLEPALAQMATTELVVDLRRSRRPVTSSAPVRDGRPIGQGRAGSVGALRSEALRSTYAALGRLPNAVHVEVVAQHSNGRRTVVSHFNKAHKGRLARILATTRSDPGDAAAVAAIARRAGMRVERRGGQLTVVVAA